MNEIKNNEIKINPVNNIKTLSENIKRVFSTNVFIPIDPKLNNKSFMYYTGFVKLVETFKQRTNFDNIKNDSERWYLYVYFDIMFNNSYDNANYHNKNKNNNINKSIKKSYQTFKDPLKKLHKLYALYIKHIKDNPEKYDFIRLFSFEIENVKKRDKFKMGHPNTLGSIIRFIPLYNHNLDYVFCININHAITPNLMNLIKEWIKSRKLLTSITSSKYTFHNINKHSLITKKIPLKKRIPAGLFGYKINKGDDLKPMEDYLKNMDYDDYKYGFDEILLSDILDPITKNDDNIYYYGYDSIMSIYTSKSYEPEDDSKLFNKISVKKIEKKLSKKTSEKVDLYMIKRHTDQKYILNAMMLNDISLIQWSFKNNIFHNTIEKLLQTKDIQKELTFVKKKEETSYSISNSNSENNIGNIIEIEYTDQDLEQFKIIKSFNDLKKHNIEKEEISTSNFKYILANDDNFIKRIFKNHRCLGIKLVKDIFGVSIFSLWNIGNDDKEKHFRDCFSGKEIQQTCPTYEDIIKNYFKNINKNPQNNNFLTLLCGFDEEKPLYLLLDDEPFFDYLDDYYTIYKINNYQKEEDIKILSHKIIEYYQKNIYTNIHVEHQGGKRRSIKKNKRSKRLKKTKQKLKK